MQLWLIVISSKTTLKRKFTSHQEPLTWLKHSFQSLLAHLENKEQIILRDVVLGEKKRDEKLF